MEKEEIDEIRKVKFSFGFDKYYKEVINLSHPGHVHKKLKCIETPSEKKREWTVKFLADA